MELVGTEGRIILTRHRGNINVATTDGAGNRDIDCRDEDFGDSHFGADKELIRALRRFCEGETPTASASEGLEATRMAMAALESMDQRGRPVTMEERVNAPN